MTPPMQGQQSSLTVIERFIAAFNRQDLDGVMALMTEGCVFENTFPPPDGERTVGQHAVRAAFAAFFGNSPAAHFETEESFALGDRVVVRWIYRWTNAGSGAGHVRGVDIYRIQGGKIAEKLSYVKG